LVKLIEKQKLFKDGYLANNAPPLKLSVFPCLSADCNKTTFSYKDNIPNSTKNKTKKLQILKPLKKSHHIPYYLLLEDGFTYDFVVMK
jgi:hypothetical protein